MKIFFRVDSGNVIGSGHLMRCLTLADELQRAGVDVLIITKKHLGYIAIDESIFTVKYLNYNETPIQQIQSDTSTWSASTDDEEIEEFNKVTSVFGKPDWTIIDHYSLDEKFESSINSTKVMVIDDIFNRKHKCNILLNQNLGVDKSHYKNLIGSTTTIELYGPKYALLKPNFSILRSNIDIKRKITHPLTIGIYFGGSDLTSETIKVVRAILKIKECIHKYNIILSVSHKDFNEVKLLIKNTSNIKLYAHRENMAKFISECDLFFGASGATSWERCCLGVPSICITSAQNQLHIAQVLHNKKAIIYLGDGHTTTIQSWTNVIFNIDYEKINLMKNQCLKICDGDGTSRVATTILEFSLNIS